MYNGCQQNMHTHPPPSIFHCEYIQTNTHTHTHRSKVQTQTEQAAFPFFNYILHLNASNAFSLQTAELINNHLLLLDSP